MTMPNVSRTTPTIPVDNPEGVVNWVIRDYKHVLRYAEAVLQDCSQGISLAAHRASIKESEKAIAEARDVTKLTRLATLFIPLTCVRSVFGMNVREFGESKARLYGFGWSVQSSLAW
jgi:Mg2+ and Co2+ transporter CorA